MSTKGKKRNKKHTQYANVNAFTVADTMKSVDFCFLLCSLYLKQISFELNGNCANGIGALIWPFLRSLF